LGSLNNFTFETEKALKHTINSIKTGHDKILKLDVNFLKMRADMKI